MTIEPRSLIRAREGASVTKAKVLNFLSGLDDGDAVFAFEGEDDRTVWCVWIERCGFQLPFEAFLCDGKREARALSHVCGRDTGPLKNRVWIFVDRDYDDLLNFSHLEKVFQTCRYSIENYFVDEETFTKIISEVFPLHGRKDVREAIIAKYCSLIREACKALEEINRILHVAAANQIQRTAPLPKKVSKILEVNIDAISAAFTDPSDLVVLERSPTDEEMLASEGAFEALDPLTRHRGKFLYLFLRKIVDLLANACREANHSLFDGCPTSPIKLSEMTLANHARRSPMPNGLDGFLDGIE